MTGLHVQGNQIVTGSGQPLRLLGVDRSGTEYACIQGWGFFDGPSDATSVQAIASWHVNAVRIPLNEDCWLGINGAPAAYSGAAYQQAIVNYVNLLNQYGLVAILDLHWTAPGSQQSTGQQPMPDQDHAPAFWTSVANTFKGNSAVIFDLFNEPYPDSNQDTTAAWQCLQNGGSCPGVSYQAAGMQELVDTVRATGATNIVMVGGVGYAGILSQWLQYRPSDPTGNLAASWHNYNFAWCASLSCWDSQVAPVAQQVPLVTGEIGENDCAHGYIDNLMAWLDAHNGSYLGWAWNTAACTSFPALISDYAGTPTNFGLGYRDHLASLASSLATPTNTALPTATATNTALPTATATNTPAGSSSTLGYSVVGRTKDTSDSNYMTGSRITVGSQAQTLSAISAYVGAITHAYKTYSLAIYTDANGVPGSLVTSSAPGTLTPNAWNTLAVSASLAANTSYWLVYNSNGSSAAYNNLVYDAATSNVGARAHQMYGTWPSAFGNATLVGRRYSIYATVR